MTNFRLFEAIDPFGRTWTAEFTWQQTAISIRHADCVDVKWAISTAGEAMDKVIALPLPALMAESAKSGRAITDPWCMKLAAAHLKKMLETWQDMDKTLVTLNAVELNEAAAAVSEWAAEALAEAQLA